MALVAIALIAASSIAAADSVGQPGPHPNLSMKPGRLPALNNVVSMDAQGVRQALCPCGRRFTVASEPRSIVHNGTTVYVCSDRCAGEPMAGSSESISRWNRILSTSRLNTNVRMKRGFETATCPCGKAFVVVNRRRALVDNGLVVFFCSEECRSGFRTMRPEERTAAELCMLPPIQAAHPIVELTYSLLPTTEGTGQGCATVIYRLTKDAAAIAAGRPDVR
jgi:ribosomal protein L24E